MYKVPLFLSHDLGNDFDFSISHVKSFLLLFLLSFFYHFFLLLTLISAQPSFSVLFVSKSGDFL